MVFAFMLKPEEKGSVRKGRRDEGTKERRKDKVRGDRTERRKEGRKKTNTIHRVELIRYIISENSFSFRRSPH